MTVQECIDNLKMAYGMPNKKETKTMAIRSLEAWEEVEKEVEEIINRPHLNMMEYALALKEIRDIIKKHLGEVTDVAESD